MGLLGDSWEDPRSLATMQMAAGLMSGGNFGQALSRGLLGYSQTMKDARDQKLEDLKMDMLKQQVASATRKSDWANNVLARLAGKGAPQASSIPASDPSVTPSVAFTQIIERRNQQPQQQEQGGFVSRLTPDDIAALKMADVADLTDVYKLSQPNWVNVNGNMVNTNAPNFQGGIQAGIHVTPQGHAILNDATGAVRVAPGSINAITQIRNAENESAASYKPIKVYNQATGREEYSNEAVVSKGGTNASIGSGGNSGPGGVGPVAVPGNGNLPAPMRNNNPGALKPGGKMASFGTPEEGIVALDRNLQSYAKQGINTVEGIISKWAPASAGNPTSAYVNQVATTLGVKPNQPLDMSSPYVRHGLAWGIMQQENGRNQLINGGGQRSGSGAFSAGPSASEAAQAEATKRQALIPGENQGKINDTWLKTSYEPVVNSGNAANEMLTNIEAARIPLSKLNTGWGSEAKGYAANVLTSLGIGGANAKMYATNVQQFQNVAMTQLKTALDAAKGPQTEGDADRGAKLFAQLKNTPQANQFILDMAEAKAQRDAMRSKFYQQALPVARDKGNLQELDTEWQQRMPSIFDMPSMAKWKGTK